MGIVTQLKRTRIVQIAHLLIAAGTECATAKKTALTVRLIVGNPLQWKQIVMTISIMMGMALPTVMIRIVPVILLAQSIVPKGKNRAHPMTNAALEGVSGVFVNSRIAKLLSVRFQSKTPFFDDSINIIVSGYCKSSNLFKV